MSPSSAVCFGLSPLCFITTSEAQRFCQLPLKGLIGWRVQWRSQVLCQDKIAPVMPC